MNNTILRKLALSKESGGSGEAYVLPVASKTVLGGVKIGDNLEIDKNGVLKATVSQSDIDTAINNAVGDINTALATLTTPSEVDE